MAVVPAGFSMRDIAKAGFRVQGPGLVLRKLYVRPQLPGGPLATAIIKIVNSKQRAFF